MKNIMVSFLARTAGLAFTVALLNPSASDAAAIKDIFLRCTVSGQEITTQNQNKITKNVNKIFFLDVHGPYSNGVYEIYKLVELAGGREWRSLCLNSTVFVSDGKFESIYKSENHNNSECNWIVNRETGRVSASGTNYETIKETWDDLSDLDKAVISMSNGEPDPKYYINTKYKYTGLCEANKNPIIRKF